MSEPTSGNAGDLPPPAAVPAQAGDVVPGPAPAQAGDAVPAVPEAGLPVPYAAGLPPYLQPGLPHPFAAAPYAGPYSGPYAAPYPVTAVPYPYAVAAPSTRRGPAVIVLGIATGVLLLAAGALGVLWFLDHDRAGQTSADQQAQLEELRDQVAQLEEDIEESETQLQRAEDDLVAAQDCPDAVQAFVDLATEAARAGEGQDPPERTEQVAAEMIVACEVVP